MGGAFKLFGGYMFNPHFGPAVKGLAPGVPVTEAIRAALKALAKG